MCVAAFTSTISLLLFSPCRYHTGSLAFGSMILAIVQVIRVILEYLDHKLKGIDPFYWLLSGIAFVNLLPRDGAVVVCGMIDFLNFYLDLCCVIL